MQEVDLHLLGEVVLVRLAVQIESAIIGTVHHILVVFWLAHWDRECSESILILLMMEYSGILAHFLILQHGLLLDLGKVAISTFLQMDLFHSLISLDIQTLSLQHRI